MAIITSTGLATEILSQASSKLQPQGKGSSNFADVMSKALNQVSESQNKAADIVKSFQAGDEVDVTKVMLAREKASLSFEATLQVRNKLLSAYKDVISMPV
jgi:flagellar hook-basal body complex protein FliE